MMRKLSPHILTGASLILGMGILVDAVPAMAQATAQAASRQRAQTSQNRPYIIRFDAAYRQRQSGPPWIDYRRNGSSSINGSTGYGHYGQDYFYSGRHGYGQYNQGYFYGDTQTRGLDFDKDGIPDQTDPDIDGDGVMNEKDSNDYDRTRS